VTAIPVRWLTVFLGARICAVLPHETEMADPAGRLSCLTGS
jgi:hypothetical protein